MKLYTVMSTYNPDEKLLKQIDSIFASSKLSGIRMSIIIRDDGSTSTHAMRILDSINTPDVKIYKENNIGLPGSFFEAMKLTPDDGNYYFFSDQDDIWIQKKVERVLSIMESDKKDNLLYVSRTKLIDDNLNIIGLSKKLPIDVNYHHSIATNIATGCTMCMSNDLFILVSKVTPRYNNIHMHDWWIYIVASFLGNILVDNEPTVLYRQHSNNVVGMKKNKISRFKLRMYRILNKDSKYNKITSQALEIKRLYQTSLSIDKLKLLNDLIYRNDDFFNRIRFFFSSNINANSKLDLIMIKTLMLLGIIN